MIAQAEVAGGWVRRWRRAWSWEVVVDSGGVGGGRKVAAGGSLIVAGWAGVGLREEWQVWLTAGRRRNGGFQPSGSVDRKPGQTGMEMGGRWSQRNGWGGADGRNGMEQTGMDHVDAGGVTEVVPGGAVLGRGGGRSLRTAWWWTQCRWAECWLVKADVAIQVRWCS